MTGLQLISFINQALFIGLFAVVLVHAVRRGSRAATNTALLFAGVAGAVGLARVGDLFGDGNTPPMLAAAVLVMLNLAPFAMLRLVDDFGGSPRWVQGAGAAAFVLTSLLAIVAFEALAPVVELATIAFFLAVGGYAVYVFAREARRTYGITRRRMAAVAIGAALFIAAVVGLFVGFLVPDVAPALGLVGQLAGLVAVIAFFIGFAPPAWIRRAWREPELRRFLERSVHLAGVADDRQAIRELQRAAAAALGATGAWIGMADRSRNVLRYVGETGDWLDYPDHMFIAGRAFRDQRRIVAVDAAEADPEHARAYEAAGAQTVIAAPVTTEDRQIGVLTVYADRAPVFIEDDLWLVELLASQTAVLIEARTLTSHASELRAREEATRMKEEFLSAAAHDLRTPLTVVLGQAELMERRARLDPSGPVDRVGLGRIVREARRLRDLVAELLDARRLEDGRAVLSLEPADLGDVLEVVRDRHLAHGVTVALRKPDAPLIAPIDRPRIEQVIENLVENALKYGAPDGYPEIQLATSDGQARIAVIDHGMGIPADERDRVFERFFRASNAQGVTDTGLGLGLYICQRVVAEHGGRIWHEETPGGGSTFVVTLPLEAPDAVPEGVPEEVATTDPAWVPPVAERATADA